MVVVGAGFGFIDPYTLLFRMGLLAVLCEGIRTWESFGALPKHPRQTPLSVLEPHGLRDANAGRSKDLHLRVLRVLVNWPICQSREIRATSEVLGLESRFLFISSGESGCLTLLLSRTTAP